MQVEKGARAIGKSGENIKVESAPDTINWGQYGFLKG